MKTCTKCLIEKPVGEFHKRWDGHASRCRSCVAAEKAEYYERNRERLLLKASAYYDANREALLRKQVEQGARYFRIAAGKENRRRVKAKRRAKMNQIEVSFTAQEHEELLRIYDGRCYVCRLAKATTLDHVVPLATGGAHIAANLRPACKSCNSSKGAKDVLDWLAPRWRPVWAAPLVPNYEVSERHRADLAQILERT